jgi:hypothetical protein
LELPYNSQRGDEMKVSLRMTAQGVLYIAAEIIAAAAAPLAST